MSVQPFEIPQEEVVRRLTLDNPWWAGGGRVHDTIREMPLRAYFRSFSSLATGQPVRRAVILMGPRRVGKTVMLLQSIDELLRSGVPGGSILYASMDTPTYTNMGLEGMLHLFLRANGLGMDAGAHVFFDEIQYVKDWERQLKSMVDTYRSCTFVASGSAAAALRMKSRESGAGRFTDFFLPPLSFAEYLQFTGKEEDLIRPAPEEPTPFATTDIHALNAAFLDYLNHGGYPEAVMHDAVRRDPGRFIRQDIIDKVLLKDLPTLYGIQNTRELNRLLAVLAYTTGNEVSLEALSQDSGVAKNTLKRYLEYLEAAFLIQCVQRVDHTAKHFKRANFFKVYLTNPSMRAALFSNIREEDAAIGGLVETAIYSQWFHSPRARNIRYARWAKGEVDIVHINPGTQAATWAYDVKWSDGYLDSRKKLGSIISFAKKNGLSGRVGATTKTILREQTVSGIRIKHFPCSLHCYGIGAGVARDEIPQP